ncbi:MAG: hypothetical protein QOC89_1767 [Paraburkholderia sp.]|nr:hypothetical protein [Paraburkholderia sp.]
MRAEGYFETPLLRYALTQFDTLAQGSLSHHTNEATAPMIDPSGEHVVRNGKYDCLVTNIECARTQIPDAPLPRLCGGPA